ncbi:MULTISPECIES: hypothetical protein [Eikenella]|uniref:hypothetical protein n=1 Tax=Eikenella TaxID=538 RepID=UPI000A7EC5CB|nr:MULTISPECIES: hypothetical protein [Eikenella]
MFELSLPLSLLLVVLLWLAVRLRQQHARHQPAAPRGHDDCSFFTREYHRGEQ